MSAKGDWEIPMLKEMIEDIIEDREQFAERASQLDPHDVHGLPFPEIPHGAVVSRTLHIDMADIGLIIGVLLAAADKEAEFAEKEEHTAIIKWHEHRARALRDIAAQLLVRRLK